VAFTPARKLNVMMTPGVGPRARVEIEIERIFVPLPESQWPAHIYARIGDNVYPSPNTIPSPLKMSFSNLPRPDLDQTLFGSPELSGKIKVRHI
jgi:hypothetical protein